MLACKLDLLLDCYSHTFEHLSVDSSWNVEYMGNFYLLFSMSFYKRFPYNLVFNTKVSKINQMWNNFLKMTPRGPRVGRVMG